MPLKLPRKGDPQVNKAKYFEVEERTFLDKNGQATTDVSKAARLFAIPGQLISLEAALSVGLLESPDSADPNEDPDEDEGRAEREQREREEAEAAAAQEQSAQLSGAALAEAEAEQQEREQAEASNQPPPIDHDHPYSVPPQVASEANRKSAKTPALDLGRANKAQLEAKAQELGLDASGTKKQISERIEAAQDN
jgi:hypothetical protein